MWLDRIGRTMTEPFHVDRLARCIDALEDVEREANAKARLVTANQAANIKTDLGALIAFGLDMDSPVAFDRDLARPRLEINRLTFGFVAH